MIRGKAVISEGGKLDGLKFYCASFQLLIQETRLPGHYFLEMKKTRALVSCCELG